MKGDRVTIAMAHRKKGKETPHYEIRVNGRGVAMAYTKAEAIKKQKEISKQRHKK